MNMESSERVTSTPKERRHVLRNAGIGVVATMAIVACADESNAPAKAGTASPTAASSTIDASTARGTTAVPLEPILGTGSEGGVRLAFVVPDGWDNLGWSVIKSDADPVFGVGFLAVANIYADPCQWVEVDPAIGPTVEDLAEALAAVPGLDPTAATDVTVDGFHGKHLEFTVPDYDKDECKGGRFGLFRDADHAAGRGPNYWAQGPNQHHELWILDVDGTRLGMMRTYFANTSPEDRDALDAIVDSVQIG